MGRKLNPQIVRYDGASGTTWRVRVRNASGQQTTETFTSQSAAEVFRHRVMDPDIGPARAIAMRAREDRNSVEYVPTLAEMLDRHLAALTGVEGRTKDDYLSLAARSWLPMLGSLRVDELEDVDIARFVNALDGRSAPKTIKNAHSLLSSVLESAVRKRIITSNPAKGIRLPRAGEQDATEMRLLDHLEFDRLYQAFPEPYRPLLMVLFGAGPRWSEATALQVGDVMRQANTLRIVRAWKKAAKPETGFRVGPPKTRKSRRTIALPAETMAAIWPLLDRAAGDWLFTTPGRGVVVRHNNFFNRIWIPACADAGLDPRPRIHDARHTHASWLLAQGVPVHVVSARLGHESIQTTVDTYGHLMPDLVQQAGLAASAAFAGTNLRELA